MLHHTEPRHVWQSAAELRQRLAVARLEGVEQQPAASIGESAKDLIEIVRCHRCVASSRGR